MKYGRSLASVACALLITLAAGTPAFASAPYGAIATEQGNDNAIGHATGYDTKQAAVAAAITECNKYTKGKDDCTLRVWFHKTRCAAYAADAKTYDYYFGGSKADVVGKAKAAGWSSDEIIETACN